MKKIILISIVCVCSFSTFAQSRYYLLYTDANISRLKKQVQNDPIVKNTWGTLLRGAENMLQRDRSKTSDLEDLGLAYRMTEDTRFADRIKQTLLQITSQESWEDQALLRRTPPWKGGLNTARASFSAAIGYDCIYAYLTPDERKKIADGIVKVGIKPAMDDWINFSANIHTIDTVGHNWWSAVVDSAGFAALAVRNEIPEAKKWVDDIMKANMEWMNYEGSILQNKPRTFDRSGGFYESVTYAYAGFSPYLFFRYAFKNVYPELKLPETPQIELMADFFVYTTYYTGNGPLSINFGDSDTRRNGNACVLLAWNLGIHKDRYAWYLHRTQYGTDRESLELSTPLGLLLHPDLPDKQDLKSPELTDSKLFQDMGWAVLRNSWNDDATMLGVKCGFTWNHSHADAGSFILFHKGRTLIIDSGRSSYSRSEYTQYYCQSEAHNVVLWDGKAQERKDPYFGVKNPGHLYGLLDAGSTKYIFADATGPTSRWFTRNYRHFLWIGDVILIIDDLESYEPGHFEWLLHYNGESKRHGLDLSIKQDNAEVLVRPLYPETFPDGGLPHDFPEKMRLEEKIGLEDHNPDVKKPYWSISHFQDTDRTKFITAITLKNEKNKDCLPQIGKFDGKNFEGIRIVQNGQVTEVYLNLLADQRMKYRNSLNVMNGWDTDAYLLALTFPEGCDYSDPKNLKQLLVADGSYLRCNNQSLVHSLSKFFSIIEYRGLNRVLQFEGQPFVTLQLAADTTNGTVTVNGKKAYAKYLSNSNIMELNLRREEE